MSEQRAIKKYEELEFRDDFMFGKVMEDKGSSFKSLPDSKVIFICTFDPFEYGLDQYTFCERCNEKQELILGDGTEKHFYNCSYEGKDIPQEFREFYDYVMVGKMEGALTRKIDKLVDKARRNAKWSSAHMKERTLIMDAKEEGREEERANTERERKRADKAESEVKKLREEIARLKGLAPAK